MLISDWSSDVCSSDLRWPGASSLVPGELAHGSFALGTDALAGQHQLHGHGQYFHVQPEAAVIHVPYVQLEALRPVYSVAAVDLRPSRQTGTHFVPAALHAFVEIGRSHV